MILEFDSFYLDKIQPKDSWKLCNFVVANEDRLKRYFPKTLESNLTPTLAEFFTTKKVTQFANREEFLFILKHIESRDIAGIIYIKELDWSKKQGEYAYCIGYPFEGQGITTKAISVLSKHAFDNLGLETLQIIVHKDNISSVKVATSNSFKWISTLPKEYTPLGEDALDMELYELYKTITE